MKLKLSGYEFRLANRRLKLHFNGRLMALAGY